MQTAAELAEYVEQEQEQLDDDDDTTEENSLDLAAAAALQAEANALLPVPTDLRAGDFINYNHPVYGCAPHGKPTSSHDHAMLGSRFTPEHAHGTPFGSAAQSSLMFSSPPGGTVS